MAVIPLRRGATNVVWIADMRIAAPLAERWSTSTLAARLTSSSRRPKLVSSFGRGLLVMRTRSMTAADSPVDETSWRRCRSHRSPIGRSRRCRGRGRCRPSRDRSRGCRSRGRRSRARAARPPDFPGSRDPRETKIPPLLPPPAARSVASYRPGRRVRISVPYAGMGGNGGALIGGSQTMMAFPRAQAVASVRQSCVVRVSSGEREHLDRLGAGGQRDPRVSAASAGAGA